MRRLTVLVVILVFVCSCAFEQRGPGSGDQGVTPYKRGVGDIWQLANGLTVILEEDNELPLVEGSLIVPAGSLYLTPSDSAAVAAFGSQLRNGGTARVSADALDRRLEELAASVSSSSGEELVSVSFSCLSEDLSEVFQYFADVAQRPRFEPERLEIWKGQNLEDIRRRKEDPNVVARLVFREVLFGDTPFGVVTDSSAVSEVDVTKLRDLHSSLMYPNEAFLVLSGNLDRDQAEALAERHFSTWSRADDWNLKLADKPAPPNAGIYFVNGDFSQATIYVGQPGPPRHTEDLYAIELFNRVFGEGSFGSRLMRRIRVESGLAYSVYGAVQTGPVVGDSIMVIQTKAESAGTALGRSLEVLEGLQLELASEHEVRQARTAIENAFVFKFDSSRDRALRQAYLRLLGYPLDFDLKYVSNLRAVTPQALRAVANRWWNLDQTVVVVVGPESAYNSLKSLLELGESPISQLPLYQAEFDQRLAGVTPQS